MTAPFGSADSVQVAIVPDFSRFAVMLRQGVDTAMREFTTRVEATLGEVERSVEQAGRELGQDFQRGGEQAERAFEELDRSARHHLDNVDRQTTAAAAGLRTKLGGAAAVAGAALFGIGAAAAAGLGALSFMGLKAAAAMEQTQISFEALLGGAEKGLRVFTELQQFATRTPFEFAELLPVAQRFFVFSEATGIAKENVVEFLTTMGNVTSVLGGGSFAMQRVALAMAQIASSGRLMGDELLQIADALPGFNARLAIANYLGITQAELAKRQAAGLIDANTALRGLLDGMRQFPGAAGAMERQSLTLLGVFSTFKDVMSQTLVAAFKPVIPAIKQSLLDVTPVFQEALDDLAPVLGKLISGLLPLLGQLSKAAVPILEPLVDALAKFVEGLPPDALQDVGVALAQVLVELGPLLPLFLEFTLAVLQIAVPALKLLAQVLTPISPLLETYAEAIHELNRALDMIDWRAVGEAIANFFVDLAQGVDDFVHKVGGLISNVPDDVEHAFETAVTAAKNQIGALIDTVQALPGRIGAAIGNLAGLLVEEGKDVVRGLFRGIASMGGWLVGQIRSFVSNNIVGAFANALGIGSPSRLMADEIGRWLPPGITMGVDQALPALQAQLNQLGARLPGMVTAPAASASGSAPAGISFGPGSIVVQFTGAAPTQQQAFDTGIKVGQGIMDAINRRGVATAAKQLA